MTDSRLLVDELNQFNTGSNICDTDNASVVHDIIQMSKLNGYKFCHVPRSMLSRVDELAKFSFFNELAKLARINKKSYVIYWFY